MRRRRRRRRESIQLIEQTVRLVADDMKPYLAVSRGFSRNYFPARHSVVQRSG